MAERLKATDCKSVLNRVRRFESFPNHNTKVQKKFCGSNSVGSGPSPTGRRKSGAEFWVHNLPRQTASDTPQFETQNWRATDRFITYKKYRLEIL